MNLKDTTKNIWLVAYYPDIDKYEETTLERVISHDVDMWAKGRKEITPVRYLSAHDSFDQAHAHIESLQGEAG